MVKAQGRIGEVAADLYTSFPERFSERKRLFLLDRTGARREVALESCWPHKGWMILKFGGVDSISDAESLIGCEVQIPRDERTSLEGDEVYVSDLMGSAVFDGERRVGVVEDVIFGAGEAPLLIVRDERKEHMIPFASAYVRRLDLSGKQIEMRLPEGLLDLDAPLSSEEKREQQRKQG